MANVFATKNGNWSDTTVWNTGALPTSADDVYSNTFTVAANTTTTVLSIRNGSATGVTAGGGFTAVNGVTLTLTGSGVVNGSGTATFTCNLTSGQSCTIAGSVTGGNGFGATNTSTGTLNVVGNCTGGTTSNNGTAVHNASTGTVTITGDCIGAFNGTSSGGANNQAGGTLDITGNCVAGNFSIGANNATTGLLKITGTCTGGPAAFAGAVNASTGTLTHAGAVQATTTGPGISGSNAAQVTILTGPFLTSSNGIAPVYCLRWFWQNTAPPATYYQIRSANLSVIRPLYTADSVGGNPATTNVRSGTIYGPSNELTGTCAVPPAGSVALGVAVDNTTGTAVLSLSDVQTAATNALTAASAVTLNQPITSLTTPNSIGERLKNSATVATVSQQISDVFSSRQ